jgi:two-component system OmpR family sensor kinase
MVSTSPDVQEPMLSGAEAHQVPLAPVVETRTLGGKSIRVRVMPVHLSDGTWLVVVGASTATIDNAIARVRNAVEFGGLPAILLAGVAAWLVAGGALRPVERMRREVADISEHGGSSAIVVPRTHDEVADLAATMNDVLGRLKRALDRERRFVTDAGHELRTPLAILQAELELAGRPGRSRAELAAAIESATVEVRRLTGLAEDLLALGRDPAGGPRPEPVVLASLVRESAAAFGPRAASAEVHIHCRVDEGAMVTGHDRQLRRAIDNLIDNALQFAPPRSEISIVVKRTAGATTIEVCDEGPGFPADFLPFAFERFRRADAARSGDGGGTGLGLALVREVADAHCGQAVAMNRASGGASVRLELPAPPPEAVPSTVDER